MHIISQHGIKGPDAMANLRGRTPTFLGM